MNRISPLALWRNRLLIVLLLCLSAVPVFARSAYDRGVNAFKSKQFDVALLEFQQAAQQDPQNAKAFFGMGMAQANMKHYPEAVKAWDRAKEIDPTLGFTKNKGHFQRDYAEAARRAGQEGSPSQTVAPSGARDAQREWMNRIMTDLQASPAYVDPSMKSEVSEPQLEKLTQKYRPDVVKIAVLDKVPAGSDRNPGNDRNEFTQSAHDYLHLGNGLLIVLEPGGLSAYTNGLKWDALAKIIHDSRASFSAGKTVPAGVEALAGRTFSEIHARQRNARNFWLFLLLIVVVGVVFITNRVKTAQKKRIKELNQTLGERMAALQDEFKRFDLETASAPDSPLIQEAKQLRSAAVDPFATAGEKFNLATTVSQYEAVDGITTQAEKLAAKARVRLEQALGRRPLDDPNESGSIPRAEDVPTEDRGACFFCSKPNRMSDLHPIQIDVEGEQRKVLACDDCYDIAKTGRQPQVLTVPDDNGRRVPWYQSNRYDPWNDYGRGGGLFGGGGMFGGNFGLMDYLLLENLFDHDRRSNTTVITPQDPGYAGHVNSDSAGDFFGGGQGAENDSVGDFMGSLLGGSGGSDNDSDAGGFFGGGGGDDFFGGDSGGGGGDDFFGGDN